ncbi:MAG: dihydrolipoamide acetyltransferase family protein [Candidatus Diapherotrites archaeon]|nr:dihydrolipoamide acetyltransferase family protein [Candidatus Diapherotrites archaeon]MDZ4256988.1 dihydrolipoamide acetyltransferase family protein [archaeon]
MPYDFKFPDVGEGTTEGTLIKWLVKEGETIKVDQAIAEIETDKAVVEIPAPKAGVILKLYGKPGELIKVGSVLATIGEAGEQAGSPSPAATPATPAPASTAPSSPVSPAPATGKKTSVPLPPKTPPPLPEKSQTPPLSSPANAPVLATPATRQLARSLNVDIQKVKGTGPQGRITDTDVQDAASLQSATGTAAIPVSRRPQPGEDTPAQGLSQVHPKNTIETQQGTHAISPLAHPDATIPAWKTEGEEERVPIKGLRKVISDRMVKSMFTAVQVTHMDECDVTALVALRNKEKKILEKKGIKLTFLPFIAKAVAAALQNHPILNASIDDARQEVVYKKYYHIGIAVDTEEGLIVPVIRDVDKKSIAQLAKEMQDMAARTRERKTAPEDLKGSTFTLTNIGTLGGTYSTPVINWPEAAILGIGKIQEKPVMKDGKIVPRHLVSLSLTFDHRLVDGAQAVRFTNEIIQHLEDPGLFLVDVV